MSLIMIEQIFQPTFQCYMLLELYAVVVLFVSIFLIHNKIDNLDINDALVMQITFFPNL